MPALSAPHRCTPLTDSLAACPGPAPARPQSLDVHRTWLTSSLEALSGLRELELHGYAVLEPACRLPTSLTRLRLVADNEQGALPTQASSAT